MKKFWAVFLVGILLCGMLPPALASGFDLGDMFSSFYNGSSDMMPKDITMPETFSITYEYIEDGKFKEVTMEKDKSDNYHYKDSEDEYLFVKDGKGYKIAIGTVSGFVYKNNDKYTFEYIKELSQKFWSFATPLDDDITLGTTTEEGTGEICGRKTNKYKVDLGFGYNLGGYSMSMSEATYYEFDQETGICLASSTSDDVNFMGLNAGDDEQEGYECTRFEISDVTLPTMQ